tara:strand:+ start:6002 stop:6469 length:468 start_codon:yes stop_codon:yes gene_type:complete
MKTVLDRVANYIEYHEENSVLNARESEALASAKSLLICADTINNTLNNPIAHHSQSLRQFLEEDEEEEVVEQPKFINGEEVRPSKESVMVAVPYSEIRPKGVSTVITEGAIAEFVAAFKIPYEKFGKTEGADYATSETFPVGDGSSEHVVGTHLD